MKIDKMIFDIFLKNKFNLKTKVGQASSPDTKVMMVFVSGEDA